MKDITDTITALEKYFAEHGKAKSMEYAYGFFDALAVLRDLANNRAL